MARGCDTTSYQSESLLGDVASLSVDIPCVIHNQALTKPVIPWQGGTVIPVIP